MSASPVGVGYLDAATAEFLDGTAIGELRIRRCDRCGVLSAPQTQACAHCDSDHLSWIAAAGTGRVVTWSVAPAHPGETPASVIAIVELDEGPWLHSRLDGVEPDAVTVGLPVAVAFEQPGGGDSVPVFRPI
jgi:uncharacterized OB-fold protein